MLGKKTNNIKNKEQYETLKQKGMSKEKATRIANTKHPNSDKRPYEERTRGQLYELAKELDIDGRSKMDKDQLIREIRKLQQ